MLKVQSNTTNSEVNDIKLEQLAYAWPCLNASALWRCRPEDFQVFEELGFEPDGSGEHVLLQIQKRDANTEWIARKLARFAGVPPVDVSFAGLKDRFAVTTQWFSVRLAGKTNPDWDAFADEEARVLQWHLHQRKLKRGSLKANRFTVILRELQGDQAELEQRLQQISEQGVPNYFTEQRFGRDGQNIDMARQMLVDNKRINDRHKRGLYLSAARSLLFNHVLSERVAAGSWNKILPGEDVLLSGSRSHFIAEVVDETIERRLAEWDIHPSGPLVGENDRVIETAVTAMERGYLADYREWCEGLIKARLKSERRSLRSRVMDLQWDFESKGQLLLSFTLDKGCYANGVIRELLDAKTLTKQS